MKNLPAVVDFSTAAIQKAAQSQALQNPVTLYPLAGGVAALAIGFVISAPLVALLGGAGIVFGLGKGIVDLSFRQDAFSQKYLRGIREMQQRYFAELPERLKGSLAECKSDRGLRQLEELENSFEDFRTLLERKFLKDGLTLGRFLGTTEQVRAGALEKLQMVIDQMKAIESIPPDLERQLKVSNRASEAAKALIRERVEHREQALKIIEDLHTSIEESLTRISEISAQIASVGMNGDNENKFESYLDDLQTLAKQASSFHKET